LEAYILPVFNDPNELESCIKRAKSAIKPDASEIVETHLFTLAKVLLISDNQEPQLEKLIESISKSMPAQFMKQFLQIFLQDKPILVKHKSASLREAFLTRQKVLEAELLGKPLFDWSMPDAKFENAEIEDFLKSKEESKIFDSHFKDLRSASAFAKRSTNRPDGYSANFTCFKHENKVKINVTKTRDLYNQLNKHSIEAESEFKSIQAFLDSH
jgi:hypothetical protein